MKTRAIWATILGLLGFALTGSLPAGIISSIIGALLV
ncbi:hypothetical protein KNV08_gp148 [Vibrio phage Quinn]|uniref:Uncharacterized protein n=1 Tax=Vibrio phage Quinn TaxID=2736265 RepID=A0A6M9Z1R4_9CAUD|nr:hypothetical protein KNV08_gp148 [Vibrio phage Quinn]QKN85386.1 hypothetical protein QUINN_166 [Vibrio phage Quinn]WBF69516.1 hypothetical protein IW18_167 [Vibrio phage IW18]WBU76382.1 hypothetical protein WYMAN_167 [Vibrio phage Wyman]